MIAYTLDASALMAFTQKEKGYEKLKKILKNSPRPFMHSINFLEVEYKSKMKFPHLWPQSKKVFKHLPITIAQLLTEEITDYSRYLKTKYHLSLADSIGLAFSKFADTTFLTCDHHELEVIAKNETVKIEFLR